MRGMAKAFAELAANGQADGLGHHEWLGLLLDREASWRQDKRFAARLRIAKLRQQASVEDIDYPAAPIPRRPIRTGRRLSGIASISAPAGIWLHRLATVLIARAKPMSCAAQ